VAGNVAEEDRAATFFKDDKEVPWCREATAGPIGEPGAIDDQALMHAVPDDAGAA